MTGDLTTETTDSENSNLSPEQREFGRFLEEGYQMLEDCSGLPTTEAIVECGKALALFRRAKEIAGDEPEMSRTIKLAAAAAYSQRGHLQRYNHNHSQALSDLSQAIRLHPVYSEDYFYRGLSYLAKGDQLLGRADLIEYLRRGEDDYLREVAKDKLAKLVPDKADTAANVAHWRNEGTRLNAEASNVANPRDEATPDWPKAVALYKKAVEAFEHALEANPNDKMTKFSLVSSLVEQAEGYRHMDEPDLALLNYQRAEQLSPNPRHLFFQGETLLEAGHNEQARATFEQFLKDGKDTTMRSQAEKYLQAKAIKAKE